MDNQRKAAVLLSGGLDSTTTLATTRAEGFKAHALTSRCDQRHAPDLDGARPVAARFGAGAHVIQGLAENDLTDPAPYQLAARLAS